MIVLMCEFVIGYDLARPAVLRERIQNAAGSADGGTTEKLMSTYDTLKDLVRTHEQQQAELAKMAKASKTEVEAARAETAVLRNAAAATNEEVKQLKAEIEALRERRQRDKRHIASAAERSRQELEAAVEAAVAREAERQAAELTQLREAAAKDVREARETVASEHNAVIATWAAAVDKLRDEARRKSARHSEQLRIVIASEEACQTECARLAQALKEGAVRRMALAMQTNHTAREASAQRARGDVLVGEVRRLEEEAAAATLARQAQRQAAELATAAAESEVRELRTQVASVAHKQQVWRAALAERHEHQVQSRVHDSVSAVRDQLLAKMEAQRKEHEAEVAELRSALEISRRQQAAFEMALRRQGAELLQEVA